MLLNDIRVDPIVRYAGAKKLCNKVNEPFTCSLLWVTKFSMQSICTQFSADQNEGLGEQITLTLVEIHVYF